jgi:uncharacterized delta-60 repeat protein
MAIARYLPSGALDRSFGIGGLDLLSPKNQTATGNAAALLSNGRLVVGGSIGNSAGVVRLLSNGKFDSSFGSGGVAITPIAGNSTVANALAVDTAGRIVVAGSSTPTGGYTSYFLARYLFNGKVDAAFGTSGIVTPPPRTIDDEFHSIAIQPDGRIVAGGFSLNYLGGPFAPLATVARFNSSGTFDATFGYNGIDVVAYYDIRDSPTSLAVLVQPDGKILAGDTDIYRLLGK